MSDEAEIIYTDEVIYKIIDSNGNILINGNHIPVLTKKKSTEG